MSEKSGIIFRESLNPSDPENIYLLTQSCGLFYQEELAVARELAEESLSKGLSSGYYFLFAETEGFLIGYTCFGPVPMTAGRFDLYWIAVRKELQGRGIGRHLMELTQSRILDMDGKRIYVETSSRKLYEPTHMFYEACKFQKEAVLKDFYSQGDDKVIYMKDFHAN